MRTIAFVGASGTGKSHRAMMIAKKYGADAIIDDGLLISDNKVLAGISAKREPTKIASVRRALFTKTDHAKEVSKEIYSNNLSCVMILGTSEAMTIRIASVLNLPEIEMFIHIEDVASLEEIQRAREMRQVQGKHVIPVPTFEIKKDFSGYFLHPLKIFQKNMGRYDEPIAMNKSIVRPTFSYLGDYKIADNVVGDIVAYEAGRVDGMVKVNSVNVRKGMHGAHIDMAVTIKYGYNIVDVCQKVQHAVCYGVEAYTSINARRVHIYVRGLAI